MTLTSRANGACSQSSHNATFSFRSIAPGCVFAQGAHLVETGPLSRVQVRRKALIIRHINVMEVRKKRPRGFKKEAQGVQVSPLNPLSVAPR